MASFIMAGRMQATIFVVISILLSLLLPPIAVFSNAAIGLITLRHGWQQGILFALLGSILIAIVSVSLKQGFGSGMLTGLTSLVPTVLIASILAFSRSWERTLQLVLLLGVAGVVLFHLLYPDAESYWKPLLEGFKPALQQIYQLSDSKMDEYLTQAAHWATGSFAAAFAIFGIISLIIARHWQAMLYNPGGFGKEFRQIRVGKQAAIALLVIIVLAVFTNQQLPVELIMVGIAVFMFQGLSLAHSIVHQLELRNTWLVVLYGLMFLLLIQMIVLLATFGIIDNFADFRKKLASKRK